MFLISNDERRDIVRLLAAFAETYPVGKSLRKANMVRVARLLIEQLGRKKDIPRQQVREFLRRLSEDRGSSDTP